MIVDKALKELIEKKKRGDDVKKCVDCGVGFKINPERIQTAHQEWYYSFCLRCRNTKYKQYKQLTFEAEFKAVKDKRIIRKCLKCDREFVSKGENRICDPCKNTSEFKEHSIHGVSI